MFDVRALQDLTFTSLEFKAEFSEGSRPRAAVYTKRGSYRGSERRPGDWSKVADDVALSTSASSASNNGMALIPASAFAAVSVPRGEIRAFYVTLLTPSPDLRYTAGTSPGRVYSSDAALEIMEGAGLSGYDPTFSSPELFEPRVWNGVVRYEVESSCDTPSPTALPTLSPTPIPVFRTTTAVVYSVTIAHPSGQEGEQMLAEVEWAVMGAVRGLLESEEELTGYAISHGLTFGGTKSSMGIAAGQECATTPDLDACTPVDSVVTLAHLSSLESQAVTYALLRHSPAVAEALSARFAATYVGERTLEARAVITLRGVPEKRMGESETRYFERVSRDFLSRAVQSGVDVLTVTVESQELLLEYDGDDGDAAHRSLSLRGSRRRRLPRKSAAIGLTTTVTGSHRPPPNIDFAALVEDSIDRESDKLQKDLAEKKAEAQGGSGSSYFENLEEIKAEVIITPSPTSAPTPAPPIAPADDGGMSAGATVGITFAVGLLAIAAILGGWRYAVYGKEEKEKKKAAHQEALLRGEEEDAKVDPDDDLNNAKAKAAAEATASFGSNLRKSLKKLVSSRSMRSMSSCDKAEKDKIEEEFKRLNNGMNNASNGDLSARMSPAAGEDGDRDRLHDSAESLNVDDLREERDLRPGVPPSHAPSARGSFARAHSGGRGGRGGGAGRGGMGRAAQSERFVSADPRLRAGANLRGGHSSHPELRRGSRAPNETPFSNSESEAENEGFHDSLGSSGRKGSGALMMEESERQYMERCRAKSQRSLGESSGRGSSHASSENLSRARSVALRGSQRGSQRSMMSGRGGAPLTSMEESEQEYMERCRAKSQRSLGASSSGQGSDNLSRAGSVAQKGSQRSMMNGHDSAENLGRAGSRRSLMRISEEEYEAKIRAKSQRSLASSRVPLAASEEEYEAKIRAKSQRSLAASRAPPAAAVANDLHSSTSSDMSSQMSKEEYMDRVRMTTGRACSASGPGGRRSSEASVASRGSHRPASSPRPGLNRHQSAKTMGPGNGPAPNRGRMRRRSYEESMLRNVPDSRSRASAVAAPDEMSLRQVTSKSSTEEGGSTPRGHQGGIVASRPRSVSKASSRRSSHADGEMSGDNGDAAGRRRRSSRKGILSEEEEEDTDTDVEEGNRYRERMARMMGNGASFTNRAPGNGKPPSRQGSKRSVVTATTVSSGRTGRSGSRRNLTTSADEGRGRRPRSERDVQDEEFNSSGSSGFHNSTPAFGYDEEEYPTYRRTSGRNLSDRDDHGGGDGGKMPEGGRTGYGRVPAW